MKAPVLIFMGFLAILFCGSLFLTITGRALPGPEDGAKISLRDGSRGGKTRRSHFFYAYYHGK